jgi:L-threonylcarbamoyladenylate synthase
VAVAAPSANLFGRLSPTTAGDVAAQLGEEVDMILDGGPCSIGVESTIVSFCHERPTLLRPGGLPLEEIEEVIGPVALSTPTDAAPLSPGRLPRHYAPRTPLLLQSDDSDPPGTDRVGLLCLTKPADASRYAALESLSDSGDLREAAANLFPALRRLDSQNLNAIVAFTPPDSGFGRAIADRLRRASCAQG